MGVFSAMRISCSGLSAERLRLDTISNNIANIDSTRTEGGGAYKRKVVSFEENVKRTLNKETNKYENKLNGVKVSKIFEDNSPIKKTYDPSHPDADKDGYVLNPNVNILNEMVDLMAVSRSFEANVTAMNVEKQMAMKALEIGR